MYMPEAPTGPDRPFLTKVSDMISCITDSNYWYDLQSKLALDKVLGKRRLTLQARIGRYVVDAGVKAYDMWGLKRRDEKNFVRAAVVYHSRGAIDGTFDEDPKVAEEELKGDPNQQAKDLLKKLHKEHDKLNYLK
jgi:hypothetical protein